VRAIVSGTFKDEQIFGSLETALSKYPKDKVELIVGAAEGFDASAKTVRVVPASGGGERTLSYDQLVLATGSRAASSDVPWKATGGYEEAVAQLGRTRERVSAAKHIVVAGAGSTGVEVAGELGFAHGKEKEVVLLCGGPALLGGDSIAPNAAAELKKLNVAMRYDAKVASTSVLPDGKTEVVLESGDKILTDLYLPTMGLVPNTEYVDASLLTEKKLVAVDECFHVKGVEDVWALGDVVSIPRAGFMITQKQVSNCLAKPPTPQAILFYLYRGSDLLTEITRRLVLARTSTSCSKGSSRCPSRDCRWTSSP